MRRRTTSATRAPEPIADGEAVAKKVTLARRLAEGSDIHDVPRPDVGASTMLSTASLDAIVLIDPKDSYSAGIPASALVEMTLYIVDGSYGCAEARRQLDQILAGYSEGAVQLNVRNLTEAPLEPSETPLLAVPTLIVRTRHDLNRTGDSDPDELIDILATCGARRVATR